MMTKFYLNRYSKFNPMCWGLNTPALGIRSTTARNIVASEGEKAGLSLYSVHLQPHCGPWRRREAVC